MTHSYREFSYTELLDQLEHALNNIDTNVNNNNNETIYMRRYIPNDFEIPPPPPLNINNLKIKSMSTSKTYYDNNGNKAYKETVKTVYDE